MQYKVELGSIFVNVGYDNDGNDDGQKMLPTSMFIMKTKVTVLAMEKAGKLKRKMMHLETEISPTKNMTETIVEIMKGRRNRTTTQEPT